MRTDMTQAVPEETPERTRPGRVYAPDVDIHEAGESIMVTADMPGVSQEGLSVMLEGNELTLEGHATVPGLEGMKLVRAEYGTGDYKRVFTLSDEIAREGITATLRNGVLHVTLPKAKGVEARKIDVKAA